MSSMSPETRAQIAIAYRRMAEEALYRPAAPSDGMGNITVPFDMLDMQQEVEDYTTNWWEAEDKLEHWTGCCNFSTREATIFAVEAARNMCGVEDEVALKLLDMARRSLADAIKARKKRGFPVSLRASMNGEGPL